MTLQLVQAKGDRAWTGQTSFSIALGAFMDVNCGVVQAVQAKSYCPRVSLFSEWKRKNRDYNRKTLGPPGPVNENRNGDTVSGEFWSKRIPAEPGPPSSTISPDFAVIPCPYDIDPLYTGKLTGTVPDGWTRDGWCISLRDRITRTRIQPGRRMLQAELAAIMAVSKNGGL